MTATNIFYNFVGFRYSPPVSYYKQHHALFMSTVHTQSNITAQMIKITQSMIKILMNK